MYFIIDGIQFILTFGGIIYSIIIQQWRIALPCTILFLIYPIINQLIYNLTTKIFNTKYTYHPQIKSHLVYSKHYNITFCGLQKLHPFDSQKYSHIVQKLLQYGIITKSQFIQPNKIPRSILLQKMSIYYLIKLCYSIPLCQYIQMALCFIPNFLLRYRVLNPMLYATQGTLVSCQVAKRKKWAINLSGGYHHASFTNGGGFCVYPDISIAVEYLRTRMNIKKIIIIDLDAHQGNGHQRDHLSDQDIFIIDCYNPYIYPNDGYAKQAIKYTIPVYSQTTDEQYLQKLNCIQKLISQFKPQFIIYNAGTDTLYGDPLGELTLSQDCIIKRDDYIISKCISFNVPVCMVLSGGYQKTNAGVIAKSIKNLMEKYD